MEQISRIGMDTSKHFFQLHGVNATEKVVLRKKLRRKEMVAFFKTLAPTVIGIEVRALAIGRGFCGRSAMRRKLIAPQLVKAFVKRRRRGTLRGDQATTMRFVPVKTAEQQQL